ncbi:GtrA family protein [Bdellovibrionota bacterium FG-1]
MRHRPSLFASFSRSQLSSFAATAADFGLLFTLTEVFHVWYVIATAAGALAGAASNFFMNRYWSFSATHDVWHRQARRYSIVSGMSMLLNTGGAYAFTEWGHLHYSISVISTSILVGVLFNFPMQRQYVFR